MERKGAVPFAMAAPDPSTKVSLMVYLSSKKIIPLSAGFTSFPKA